MSLWPLALALALPAAVCGAGGLNPIDAVNVFIGTGGDGFGIGSNNPGAQVPFGALRLGPDTSLGLGAHPWPLV